MKQPQNPACHNLRCLDNTTEDNKNNHSLYWPAVEIEHNGDCDTIGEVYGNSKFADFPLNVNNSWQKNSSQSNHYDGKNLSNKKNTDCRFLGSHSGAIQAQKTSRYDNPQFDSQGNPDLTT